MRPPTFEDFLEEKFITDISPTTNKDNFEDRFENWTSELEYDDWTSLADEYGKFIVQEMQNYYADIVE